MDELKSLTFVQVKLNFIQILPNLVTNIIKSGHTTLIKGEPDVDYPILATVPDTSFDCDGRNGIFADVEVITFVPIHNVIKPVIT